MGAGFVHCRTAGVKPLPNAGAPSAAQRTYRAPKSPHGITAAHPVASGGTGGSDAGAEAGCAGRPQWVGTCREMPAGTASAKVQEEDHRGPGATGTVRRAARTRWSRPSGRMHRGYVRTQSRVGRKHTMVAMATAFGRRDQCREMVEQLQRGQRQRRGAIALRFGQPVGDVLIVEQRLTLKREQRSSGVT